MTRFREQRLEARLFAIGSSLFAIGALLASVPGLANPVPGVTFFVGSIFFTTAASIQWLLSGRPRFAGWSGADASDWWSAAIQFVGTLFFNVSTFAAIFDLPLLGEVKHVWRPDVYGSAALLVSSVLAVVACTDRDRLWDPEARRAIKGRGVFRACRVKRAPEVLRAKLVRKDFGEFKARREFAEMLGLRASKECRARLVQWVRQA